MSNVKLVPLLNLAIVGVIFQIVMLVAGVIISVVLGVPPESALESFESFNESELIGLLKDDSYNMALIFMYIFSSIAMFLLLKDHRFALSLYATIFIVISIIIMISSQSNFSMMHLSKQYYNTSDPMVKSQLLAAGEAVIAKNMWNSTSSFFSGILMQGGGVLICIAMISSNKFSKFTILSGLVCNGFDLVNHLVHYSFPQLAAILLYLAGPFYLIWYILMIADFRKNLKTITT